MKFALLSISLILVLSSQSQIQHTVKLENVQSISILQQYTFENATFRDILFQPNSERIAVVVRQREDVNSLNGQVVFLDIRNFQPLLLANSEIFANTLAFSPDGTLFAVGSEQGEIRVFSSQTLEMYTTLQAGIDIVNDLAISSNNDYLGATFAIPTIVHEGDVVFRLFALSDGQEIVSYSRATDIYGGGVTFDELSETVFFSTTNVATSNVVVHEWEITTESEVAIYEGQGSASHNLLLDPQNKALFYITLEGIGMVSLPLNEDSHDSLIGSIQEGESIVTITLHPTEPILAIGFLKEIPRPEGGPSTTNAGIIRLYNTQTSEELITLEVPEGAITNLAFNSEGTLLASGGMDGTVRLWGVPAGE